MGILDGKSRIIDTVLTQEGKRQVAQGKVRATYVSFTDSSAIYNTDTIVSGGLEPSNRFVLEAGSLYQDQITIESDDSGLLQEFIISDSRRYDIRQGQVLSSSNGGGVVPVTGSQFNSLAESLLGSSINNFKNLYILKSPDPTDEKEKNFFIGPEHVSYSITPSNPISQGGMKEACINNVESLFYDKKLSHILNFQFLPPVNSSSESGTTTSTPLGTYTNLNQEPIITYDQILTEINNATAKGYGSDVRFIETSKNNNLVCQMFELSNGVMNKLDVVDFGSFQSQQGTKHVFFVGKVYTDSYNTQVFVRLFTLVFES